MKITFSSIFLNSSKPPKNDELDKTAPLTKLFIANQNLIASYLASKERSPTTPSNAIFTLFGPGDEGYEEELREKEVDDEEILYEAPQKNPFPTDADSATAENLLKVIENKTPEFKEIAIDLAVKYNLNIDPEDITSIKCALLKIAINPDG